MSRLQFGDQGLTDAVLRGSGLGIEAARLQLAQQAQEMRRQQILRAQQDDAAARDSMLSEIQGTAVMPAPTGTEADAFATPTPVTGPITPEMRRAPAAAVQQTHAQAISEGHRQRAQQEDIDRTFSTARNVFKNNLGRYMPDETFDKWTSKGVVWPEDQIPPSRQTIPMDQVMRHLMEQAGMDPAIAPRDIFVNPSQALPMIEKIAAAKPKAHRTDWMTAGASPDEATMLEGLNLTGDDVQRYMQHKESLKAHAKDQSPVVLSDDDAERLLNVMPGLARGAKTREDAIQKAKDFAWARDAKLVNEEQANISGRVNKTGMLESLRLDVSQAEDDLREAERAEKNVRNVNEQAAANEAISSARERVRSSREELRKHLRSQAVPEEEGPTSGGIAPTGGANPQPDAGAMRTRAPAASVGDPGEPATLAAFARNVPMVAGETKDQWKARVREMFRVQGGSR